MDAVPAVNPSSPLNSRPSSSPCLPPVDRQPISPASSASIVPPSVASSATLPSKTPYRSRSVPPSFYGLAAFQTMRSLGLLDRGELDPEGAELVDFLLGDLEIGRAHV